MIKKVLVTGAAGFIGSHLCEELVKNNYKVKALVHYNSSYYLHNLKYLDEKTFNKLEIISGDIIDEDFCKKIMEDVDAVLHLAALISIPYSYIAIKPFIYTNIIGTENLLRAALEKKIKLFIHTSTSETYGTAEYVPIDEKHPLKGQSPYSATKIGADKIVESYVKSFNLPAIIIRPFNTFGPRQSQRAVIPTIIAQTLVNDKYIMLGNLEPIRDLNFVKNTVKGYILALNTDLSNHFGEVFNISYGEGISIKELAETIINISGKNLKIKIDEKRIRPAKSEVMKLVGDFTKAQKILGYKPDISLTEGLKITYEWFKNFYNKKTEIMKKYIV